MSGDRQHFFPRFLAKGFASKTKKKEVYTWVFVKDRKPYEANIKNIGIEKHFYGTPENSQVDDLITEKENEFAIFIEQLRKEKYEIDLDSRLPAEFIAHLIVRTQHLRNSLTKAGETTVDIIQKNFQTPEDFKNLLINLLRTKPEEIENSLRKEFHKKFPSIPPDSREKFVKSAILFIPQIIEQQHKQGYVFSKQLLDKMNEKMPSIVKGSQIKALTESVVPEKHLKKFKFFKWKLFVKEENSFISGDIGPIGYYKSDNCFQPYLFSKGDIIQALLPISDQHIIVGGVDHCVLEHTCEQINEATALTSKYYFISKCITDKNLKLSSLIGKRSLNISDTEIKDAEKNFRSQFYGEN